MTKISTEIGSVSRTGHGRGTKVNGVSIDGLDELCEAFAQLGEDAVYKLSGPSVDAANVVLNRARAKINDVSGDLAAGLKVTKPGKSKGHAYRIIAKVGFGKGAQHGVPLELGHNLVLFGNETDKHVKERPFLRPAADESKNEVTDIMADAMNKILDEMGGNK